MWPYALLLLFPAIFSLSRKHLPRGQANLVWLVTGSVVAAFVGLRHEVGGDWPTYEEHFWQTQQMSFADALVETKDPGYYGLSWLIGRMGGDLHAINLVCAALLVIGTVAFVRRQAHPWLGLVAAIPYLVIVVGMGYTRQAAAIGCVMLGLVALGHERVGKFVFWVIVGATFHKSAVLLIPIAALTVTRRRAWTFFWVAMAAALAAWLFLYESSNKLWANYVESEYAYASEGAGIRVAMNCLAAVVFLMIRKRLPMRPAEYKLWSWISYLSFACVPLLLVSATAVDRVALYFIPLQLYTFANLPQATASRSGRTLLGVGAVAYFVAVQAVWFTFASHASAWLPYRSVLGS
jgi:hypothetical protein